MGPFRWATVSTVKIALPPFETEGKGLLVWGNGKEPCERSEGYVGFKFPIPVADLKAIDLTLPKITHAQVTGIEAQTSNPVPIILSTNNFIQEE